MALPMQATPIYTCELPSDKREVKFRPFLVKEQKYLMVARESEDSGEILEAIKQLIMSVTSHTVDPSKLPTFDLEYLFLKIRAKSVGENTTVVLACDKTDCKGTAQVEINIDKIEMDTSEIKDSKIMLNESVGVELKFPTANDLAKVAELEEADQVIELIKVCIASIFDDENIYDMRDTSDQELTEFVEGLTMAQVEEMTDFIRSAPSLEHKVSYTCNTCNEKGERVLKGLVNFF